MFHGDVGMIVGNAEIVNSHDILVLETRDDFIFLQEAVEADDALGDVRHLIEHLEHHDRARTLALGEIDRAHAAAADLPNAAMAADHHGSEAIALFEIRMRAQHGERLSVLARGGHDRPDEPITIDLAAVEPVQAWDGGGFRAGRVLQHEQHDGRELGFGQQSGRQSFRSGGRRCFYNDDRVKSDGGKLRLERIVFPQTVFDEIRVRPLDLNMLFDQQPVVGARCDHQ